MMERQQAMGSWARRPAAWMVALGVLGALGCDAPDAPDAPDATDETEHPRAANASGIVGGIDGAIGDDTIRGWACVSGQPQSIAVHLYLGGPAGGGGAFIAAVTANLPSEPAVATACHSTGTAYRYQFVLTAAQRLQYAGQPVYVYGISPTGQGNPALSQSGAYAIPVTLTTPVARSSVDWFVPNQMAAGLWYLHDGHPINGHIEGSFSNLGLWPNLAHALTPNGGGLGMYAAEINHTSDASLLGFRQAGLAVATETPAWTQCADGWTLANLEINGQSPPGQNLFCSIFQICSPSGVDPNGRGWFVSSDGHSYAPEEIILDERMPGLLPVYDTAKLFDGSLTWAQRTAAIDYCPTAAAFNPNVDRITGFANDYAEYALTMKARFPTTHLAFHWNVNPAWEWRDFDCLAAVNQRHPTASDFENHFFALDEACHRDTDHLVQVVQALCNVGVCPTAAYMDMDYMFNTPYTVDVLRRNKQALANLGVGFGLDIVSGCDSSKGQTVNIAPDGQHLICITRPGGTDGALVQEGMLNVVMFFIKNGIIDGSTRLRIGTWSWDPVEQGLYVNEGLGSTLAATANRIFNELLLPAGFARFPSASYQPASGAIQPAGFFQVKSSGIFVSNGHDAYCGVASWNDFLALGGKPDLSNVAHPGGFPNGMRADPICPR